MNMKVIRVDDEDDRAGDRLSNGVMITMPESSASLSGRTLLLPGTLYT